jgi:hypothetical protein
MGQSASAGSVSGSMFMNLAVVFEEEIKEI